MDRPRRPGRRPEVSEEFGREGTLYLMLQKVEAENARLREALSKIRTYSTNEFAVSTANAALAEGGPK